MVSVTEGEVFWNFGIKKPRAPTIWLARGMCVAMEFHRGDSEQVYLILG
jgi:hypothetical protein